MNRPNSLAFRIFKKMVRMLSALDSAFQKLPRIFLKTAYVRVGSCNQCGECCKNIAIGMERRMLNIKLLRNAVIRWNAWLNGLIYKETIFEEEVILFECSYLGADGLCGDYENRPQFCRDYPKVRDFFLQPVFYPKCSYVSVPRKLNQKNPKLVLDYYEEWLRVRGTSDLDFKGFEQKLVLQTQDPK